MAVMTASGPQESTARALFVGGSAEETTRSRVGCGEREKGRQKEKAR